ENRLFCFFFRLNSNATSGKSNWRGLALTNARQNGRKRNQRSERRMKLIAKTALILSALILVGLSGATAYADGIVLVSPSIQKLVPPLAALNLQHQGHSTTEAGGVRWDGSSDVDFGDISAGPHQHTISLTDLGVGRATDLRVLLNINETNG